MELWSTLQNFNFNLFYLFLSGGVGFLSHNRKGPVACGIWVSGFWGIWGFLWSIVNPESTSGGVGFLGSGVFGFSF